MKKTVYNYISNGILLSLILVLCGSINNLAYTYNSSRDVESSGFFGWAVSIGLDIALTATMFGLAERVRQRSREYKTLLIWLIVGFCAISFMGNYYSEIANTLNKPKFTLDEFLDAGFMTHFRSIFFGASLSLITVAISIVYTIITKTVEKQKQEEKPKAESRRKLPVVVNEQMKPLKIVDIEQPDLKNEIKKPEIIENNISPTPDIKKKNIELEDALSRL